MGKKIKDYTQMASRCKCCDERLMKTEMHFGMCRTCRGASMKEFSYLHDHEYHHMELTESTNQGVKEFYSSEE